MKKRTLTAWLLTLAMLLSLLPTAASAASDETAEELTSETVSGEGYQLAASSGTCGDNLTWVLEDGVLTISGTGSMTNYSSYSSVPWYDSRESITSVVIGGGVTSIGSYAFYYCTGLTSVTIGSGVTSIGRYAFYNCTGLTSVTIPDSVTSIGSYAFGYCTGLTSVTIGSGVTSIGSLVFYNCTGLTSVTIPDSVTSIGDYAFSGCAGLTSVAIPDSVTSIGRCAFHGCTSLTSVTIPDSVTSIGGSAFLGCTGLTEILVSENNTAYCSEDGVLFNIDMTELICYPAEKTTVSYTIPGSVATIDYGAFEDCTALTSVTIPDSVTSIGSYAFDDCHSLTSVAIPGSVTRIGWYAFYGCTGLTTVTIGSGVTSIGDYAFCGCTGLTTVTIGSGVTSIGSFAFSGCTGLTSVTTPDSVTSIGSYAFRYCSSLINITIPGGVESIESYTFAYCTALTAVAIPTSVTAIDDSAFRGCSALTDVYYGGTSETWSNITIGSDNTYLDSATIHYNSASFLLGHVSLNKLGVSSSGIALTWNSAAYAQGYYIYRSTGEEDYQLLATIKDPSTLSYLDTNVENNATYSYYVQAYAGDAVGTYSAESVTYLYIVNDGYLAVSLSDGELNYTSASTVTKQIVCTQRNGIYFLNGKTLSFYALDTGEYTWVYTFSGCVSAYEADGLLYVLVSTSQCLVYDLEEQAVVNTLEIDGDWSGTAVGADASGRIYVAGQTTLDGETTYGILLYSQDGTLLSQMVTDARIYSFNGFDSTNGNFYMESYYNWVYWGYDHPGHAVTMGTVTDDTLEAVNASSSVLISGLLTYSLNCIEYLCQSWYYLHQEGAALLGGRYLVTASTTYGRVRIMDSNSENLDLCLSFSREGVEYESDSDYDDTGSIGVRAVYNEANDSIIIYENNHVLTEYSLETGEELNRFETQYNVFNLLMEGDTVYIIEKEDDAYYLEVLEWSDPATISLSADSTALSVGDTETLTVVSDSMLSAAYTWESSDSSVVSVTSAGRIAAWSEGTARITATSRNGLTASITITVSASGQAAAATTQTVSGGQVSDNTSDNNYTVWSSTMDSALYESGDGTLVRVEYVDSSILVEEWSTDGVLLSSRTLACELPLYGGFYSGEKYNFLVFGQSNLEEDDSCEVLRVVKYSKDWERLDACSIYGANTYIPFDAGSLRMAETNGSLYLYTCHEMYDDDDSGTHHQANMTFVISQEDMSVQQSYYDVMNIAQAGYVSHSFNQFIQTDGTYVYRVDHGDANPRAISITKCSVDGSITDVSYTYALTILGTYGANATGVSIGGFELSTDSCLIVGNSVDQSDKDTYSSSGQRNIFLTVTDKDLEHTTTVWLTDYTDSDSITPRTPQLVKLNDEQFLVLWEEYNETTGAVTTKLVTVSADGEIIDQVDTNLRLSDCQPIFTSEGTVCWYVTDGGDVRLYTVNPYRLADAAPIDLSNFTISLSADSYIYDGTAKTPVIAVTDGSSTLIEGTDYKVSYKDNVNVGTASVVVTGIGAYTGTATISFAITEAAADIDTGSSSGDTTHTHSYTSKVTKAATCTETGVWTYTCSCGDSYTETIPATGHTAGEAVQENMTAATASETGSYDSVVYCTVCGKEISRETITVPATGTGDSGDTGTGDTSTGDTDTGDTGTGDTGTGDTGTGDTATGDTDTGSTDNDSTHTHTWDEGVVTLAATRVSEGEKIYTCTVCGETKTETVAKLTGSAASFLFDDVTNEESWYYTAVYWAYDLGITEGYSDNTFRPNNNCTRAEFATFLYALANAYSLENAGDTESKSFTDVTETGWYYTYVMWAAENGLVSGYTDGTFKPNNQITRAEAVTMLYGFYKTFVNGGVDPELEEATETTFSDLSEGSWYYTYMLWAIQNGVVSGYPDGTCRPNTSCTRSVMVVLLHATAEHLL